MKLSCAETVSPWNRKDSMGVQSSLGMDLSKLPLFKVFGTAWGHPPQENIPPWLSSPSALIAPCLLPAVHPSSTGTVWSRRAMMKLLPVAPLLLLLLTTLEARPKPAGEPWWGVHEQERNENIGQWSSQRMVCCVTWGDRIFLFGSIPRRMEGHKLPGPSMVALVMLALGTP